MLDIGVVSRAQEEFGHATLLYSGQLGTALFLQLKTGVSISNAQVGQEKGDWPGSHDPAAIRVKVEWAGRDWMLVKSFLNELLGQFRTLPVRHHPADGVAAEDIEDDVQIKVGPLYRTPQLGDVPAPQLVGRGGQQLGLPVRRRNKLMATLARFSFLFQNPVHGADGAEILALIQQGGLHGGGERS